MKRILGYIGRRGVVYLLLVLAVLIIGQRAELAATYQRIRDPAAHGASLQQIAGEIREARDLARSGTVEALQAGLARTREDLRLRRAEQEAYRREHDGLFARLNPLAAFDPMAGKLALQVETAQRKEAVLASALAAANGEITAKAILESRQNTARQAADRCNATAADVATFDRASRLQQAWQRFTNRSRNDLISANHKACADWRQKRDARDAAARALQGAKAGRAAAVTTAEQALSALASQWTAEAERSLQTRLNRFWTEYNMNHVLWQAAGWLALIMLTPYLIRTLFYYGLAPLAGKSRHIRLGLPGGAGAAIPPVAPSATSVAVRIGQGEELLVRSGFLQTSSIGGAKRTVPMLDWKHPVACWVTGLVNLTRIRGEGQLTTLSAITDPFAEVSEIALPEGAALALHPRALVAVVQNEDRPMRISTHWRLFSLNAWLTVQLRYFAFHGPARLVIRGGRGVRVERAEQGRIFGQDQLVGFSGDLAYSVTRNETFIPYLLGREPLLRDRVDEGQGILIIEEAPLSLRGHTAPRHGLEGAFDALLKPFGF